MAQLVMGLQRIYNDLSLDPSKYVELLLYLQNLHKGWDLGKEEYTDESSVLIGWPTEPIRNAQIHERLCL